MERDLHDNRYQGRADVVSHQASRSVARTTTKANKNLDGPRTSRGCFEWMRGLLLPGGRGWDEVFSVHRYFGTIRAEGCPRWRHWNRGLRVGLLRPANGSPSSSRHDRCPLEAQID